MWGRHATPEVLPRVVDHGLDGAHTDERGAAAERSLFSYRLRRVDQVAVVPGGFQRAFRIVRVELDCECSSG
jgi:hypothetical protein